MKQRREATDLNSGIAKVSYEKPPSDFSVNLRRLIYFHHWSAREAARVIGVSEHAMSAWLTEKRKPGLESVMRIAGLYDVDPRLLSGDQFAFAKELADSDRIQHAEANIGHAVRGVGAVTPLRRQKTREEA
jgi:transcriptional regulator with XRE-family HTH domain